MPKAWASHKDELCPHREAEIMEMRQPQQHVRATDSALLRTFSRLTPEENLPCTQQF